MGSGKIVNQNYNASASKDYKFDNNTQRSVLLLLVGRLVSLARLSARLLPFGWPTVSRQADGLASETPVWAASGGVIDDKN